MQKYFWPSKSGILASAAILAFFGGYFGIFRPFLGLNEPFRLFSHHILWPTGPMKEKNILRYPPFNSILHLYDNITAQWCWPFHLISLKYSMLFSEDGFFQLFWTLLSQRILSYQNVPLKFFFFKTAGEVLPLQRSVRQCSLQLPGYYLANTTYLIF